MKYVAGVDIGGTNTVFGLVDEQGSILCRGSVSTIENQKPEELVRAVSENIKRLIAEQSLDASKLQGVGIGAPNGNFFKGTVEFAPNLNWFGVVPLAQLFQQALGVPAVLTNDANAAAMGEMIFGGARDMKDFLFITLGTGLGSGIVVNGEMVYGHDGFAGEIGHVIVDVEGRQCGCGRKGCLETYCSATGILKTYLRLKVSGLKSEDDFAAMHSAGKIDGKYIFDKAKEGESEALEAFRKTGKILGLALANCVVFTSPEAIFLFGGLALAGDLIFDPVRESFERNLLNIYKGKIKILPSQLKESEAAILGAASLVLKYHQ
jgi:glucokinase